MAREKQLKTVDGVLSNDETKEEEACYSTFEGYVYQVRKNKNNKWVRSRGPYDDTTPASSAVTVEDDKEQWELICQNCWGLMKLIVRPLLNCPSAICKEQGCSTRKCDCFFHLQNERKFHFASSHSATSSDFSTRRSSSIESEYSNPGLHKPKRLILVRHEESLGNTDQTAYERIPDWLIPLTEHGITSGDTTGKAIKNLVGNDPVYFYTSPYQRTKHTCSIIVDNFPQTQVIGIREEPRMIEQQFGNFQKVEEMQIFKQERRRYGSFFYRFPNGESGLDVYNRTTDFISTLFRDFANPCVSKENLNVIIVTHGLTLRLFLMRWFKYSVEEFEKTTNPENGGMVIMERQDGQYFELTPESMTVLNLPKAAKPYFEMLPDTKTGKKKRKITTEASIDENEINL